MGWGFAAAILVVGILLLIAINLGNFNPVFAGLIKKTNLDLYLENDMIVLGEVVYTKDFAGVDETPKTEYKIKILQHIKSDKSINELTAIGLGSQNATRHFDNETIFFEGQRIFLFLNNLAGTYIISPYSNSADLFNPDSQFVLAPLKLFKAGISIDMINCKSNLVLVKKINDTPACIKPDSIEPLMKRGWLY